jgi:hypothetical protein
MLNKIYLVFLPQSQLIEDEKYHKYHKENNQYVVHLRSQSVTSK